MGEGQADRRANDEPRSAPETLDLEPQRDRAPSDWLQRPGSAICSCCFPTPLSCVFSQLVALRFKLAFEFLDLRRGEPVEQIPHPIPRQVLMNLPDQVVCSR